jgi:hypothetical protein
LYAKESTASSVEVEVTGKTIIAAIEQWITQHYYGAWTVGVTDDPARRKKELRTEGRDLALWQIREADSEESARRVEKHFLDRGCKQGLGDGENPTHVYIY